MSMSIVKKIEAVVGIGVALVLSLTGCSTTIAPEDVAWQKVAVGDIVAVDSTTGVYINGYMRLTAGTGGGRIDSEGVIDYRYARVLADGGIREDLVSTTYERFTSNSYPGSRVVTIYQDAQPDGSDARIEIYKCALPEDLQAENEEARKTQGPYFSDKHTLPSTCVTPAGDSLKYTELRVDVHVPPGAVVETFEGTSEEEGTDG